MKQKIGIMGGTFNPIHIGHLVIAQNAVEDFGLDKVLFIPSAVPPHKDTTPVIDARYRREMVLLAIEDSTCFEESDVELQREGASYAVDTLRALYEEYENAEFYFIIGSDSLKELYLWKDIYSLLTLCHFITYSRPGIDIEQIRQDELCLDSPWPERLLKNVRRGRHLEISSSDIRWRLAEGLSIKYIVSDAVRVYIYKHGLYGSGK